MERFYVALPTHDMLSAMQASEWATVTFGEAEPQTITVALAICEQQFDRFQQLLLKSANPQYVPSDVHAHTIAELARHMASTRNIIDALHYVAQEAHARAIVAAMQPSHTIEQLKADLLHHGD